MFKDVSLFLNTQVQPKHVKEAFRLLNKSIIRVDSPDINFDQEEDEDMNGNPICQSYHYLNKDSIFVMNTNIPLVISV